MNLDVEKFMKVIEELDNELLGMYIDMVSIVLHVTDAMFKIAKKENESEETINFILRTIEFYKMVYNQLIKENNKRWGIFS